MNTYPLAPADYTAFREVGITSPICVARLWQGHNCIDTIIGEKNGRLVIGEWRPDDSPEDVTWNDLDIDLENFARARIIAILCTVERIITRLLSGADDLAGCQKELTNYLKNQKEVLK